MLSKLKIFRENDSLSNSVSHFIADVVLHTGTELLVGTKLLSTCPKCYARYRDTWKKGAILIY